MIAAATVEVLAESLAIVKAEGIDPQVLVKAIEHHGIRSGMSDLKMPKLSTAIMTTRIFHSNTCSRTCSSG